MPAERADLEVVNKIAQRILLFLALAGLLAALGRFAQLRFQSGELYPAYSTLRTDPLGAKALFESLKRIEPGKVRQNFEATEKIPHGSGVTTLFLAVNQFISPDEEAFFRELARDGGRVVLALDGRSSPMASAITRGTVAPAPAPPKKGANTNTVLATNLQSFFGLTVRTMGSITNDWQATREIENELLPETIQWFGRYSFGPASNNWETVYMLSNRPVVLQQKVGLGTLVVVADSFPFSNEALHEHREPAFLLWILGNGQVIFDETHLGVRAGTGVAVLMREFRLHGLIAGCLLLVGLWIWRNGSPLVPPPQPIQASSAESVEGKTARDAIIHLLRRNLDDAQVLRAGLDEWEKSHSSKFYWESLRLAEARKVADHFAASPKPRDLAAAHQQISDLLFPKQT
jgi:hypothetical protein